MRLNFQTSPERIEKVLEEKAIEKLDAPARQRLTEALQTMDASVLHRNREQFSKLLKKALNAHDVFPSTPEMKAILNALSERDPEADREKQKAPGREARGFFTWGFSWGAAALSVAEDSPP